MKNKNTIMFFLFLLFINIMLTGCGNSGHFDANDTGMGKNIKLKVKPDPNSSDVLKNSDGNYTVKWVDTGLLVVDQMQDADGNIIPPGIGLSISGAWYPWGMILNDVPHECTMTTCSQSNDDRCQDLDGSTLLVQTVASNNNCYLTDGNGIYVLVAKRQSDNTYSDPNANFDVASGPSCAQGFYTAHIGDFKVDAVKHIVTIDRLWSCTKNSGKFVCNQTDINQLVGGKIYLKISDAYYPDNDADNVDNQGNRYVEVSIKTGIYYPNFISSTLAAFRYTIETVSNALKNAILQSLQDVIFVVIMLYFCLTAFGFMTGLVKLTQTEAVVRLLKIGIVAMLTSPNNIITTGFTSLYESLASFASNIIADNLPYMPKSSYDNSSGDTFGNQIGYLAIYDMVLNQVISIQVHTKIWALLLSERFWCVPALYVLLVIIVLVIFRSLILYIVAYIQITIAILILPLLVVMLLFQTTADLFQNWLKYMANSAFLIVVATMGMGLTLSLMTKDLSDLLNYSVTWKSFFWDWLGWWFPDDQHAVSNAINVSSYLSALMTALICQSFVEQIPQLADSLSSSQLSPSQNAFDSLWSSINEGISSLGSKLRSFNAKYGVGRILNMRYNSDGSDEGKSYLDKWKITRDRADLLYYKYVTKPMEYGKSTVDANSIFSSTDNLKDIQLNKELEILKSQNAYDNISIKKYSELIQTKEETFQSKLSKITVNGNEIPLKDGQYKFADGTLIGTQDEVQQAIANNEQIGVHQVQYCVQGNDRNSYNAKIQELGNIKRELEKIKRN